MGQAEIIKLLKKEKKWLSSKEIAKKLKVSSIARPLNVLFKSGDIMRREAIIETHHNYQWKIRD